MYFSTGHFSQLVWRDSKEVGIGTAQSKSGNFFLVARYSPRGNIDGKFNDNVQDVAEQSSDQSSQETKDNNQPNITPGKEALVENRLFLKNKSRKCSTSFDIKHSIRYLKMERN